MRNVRFSRAAALVLCCIAGHGQAEEVRLSVPGGGVLVLPAPDDWRSGEEYGGVPTIALTPANGRSFLVMVSTLVGADGRVLSYPGESLRRLVEAGAEATKSQSVEKSLPIRNFGARGVQGHYFSATDKAPKPGEFKYMTQGALSVGALAVTFTILSNGHPQAAVEPALRMLSAARRE